MRRTKAEAEETRARLLDVAERLFFECGTSAVTFDKIAAAAGVTRGAVYWHFANKAELMRALDELTALPAEEMFALAITEEPDEPLEMVLQVALKCLRLIAGDERRQRIYTVLFRCEYRGDLAPMLQRDRETARRHYFQLVSLFELARAKGQLAPHWAPATAAKLCQGFLTGILYDWLKDRDAFDLVTHAEEALTALFASFRGAGSGSRSGPGAA